MKLGGDSWEGQTVLDIKFVNQIKILGIFFSNTVDARFIPENITYKIKTLERNIAMWSRRSLSIQGKILIKCLAYRYL